VIEPSSNPIIVSAQFLGLALLVIAVTRYLLVAGLEEVSRAYGVPKKVQGQLLGYATSAPELVGTAATAARGLLGAGLWNIAASNIINWALFLAAALYYRRGKTLLQRSFAGEAGFALAAVSVPLVLAAQGSWSRAPWMAVLLLSFFCFYLLADRALSARMGGAAEPAEEPTVAPSEAARRPRGPLGIVMLVGGVVGIVLIGHSLGAVAEVIVVVMNVPQWAIGWILGVVTSLPEMTTFFAVFAAARKDATGYDACQVGLDNLAASNMSNVGLVYPIGILLFLYVAN